MKAHTTQQPRQGMTPADRQEAQDAVLAFTLTITLAFLILAGICKACER